MNRVPDPAEDVTHNPTAPNDKNTASAKSTFNDSASDSSGETGKTHGFSKTLAEIKNSKGEALGFNAAIILRYLSAISRKYGRDIGGRRWVRVNLDHISEQYSYMGRSTIDENLLRLEQFGCCEIEAAHGELKKRKNDRTRCYHIPKRWMDAAEDTPRYFNSAVAEVIKVPAAVIYYNFCHWLSKRKEEEDDENVQLSPSAFMDLLPFSESTIKRAIHTLVDKGYIHPLSETTCWYLNGPKQWGSNPDDKGSKADEVGSKADEKGSKADNYIDCNIIDELETNSKPKPAASVSKIVSDDKKANDEPIHLFNDTAYADEQDRKQMDHMEITSDGSAFNSSTASRQDTEQHESISPFDAPVSCHEETQGSVSQHLPSTVDSSDEVEPVNGKWPMVKSFEELHQINCNSAEMLGHLNLDSDSRQKLDVTITTICAKTMGMVDLDIMDELYDNPEGDEIIQVLLPKYHQFLDQTQLNPSSQLTQIIYHGALECMVGAFLWPRDNRNSYTHPIHSLISICYTLHLVLWRRDEDAREQSMKDEFNRWRKEYASVDEHKENDPDLSPAEKMRVFRNALNTRNKVGWIWFDQTHQTHRIQVTNLGLQRIQKLFTLNPELTPADLLPIMDGCMNEYSGRPAPPKNFKRGVHWHARMGHRLHIFASYLKTIVKQLGISSPVKLYLNDTAPPPQEAMAA